MRLLDRIASWFGYVPAERLTEFDAEWMKLIESEQKRHNESHRRWKERWDRLMELYNTKTDTVYTQPLIIVSADFKRGIPCS